MRDTDPSGTQTPTVTLRGMAAVLAAGGAMGSLLRRKDWSNTPLGPPDQWPSSLAAATSICLQSRFPMIIFWGPQLVQIYNDAYRPILGDKHPESVGQPAQECWAELWHVIGPMLHGVLERGEATFSADLKLLMDRHDYPEETFFTFSYSPIRTESGRVGGVFCAMFETTERVLGERRLGTLLDLGTRQAEPESPEEACRAAVAVLARNAADVPAVRCYLREEHTATARLAAWAGELPGPPPPSTVEVTDPAALAGERRLVLPLADPDADLPAGLLVLGLNPNRPLDAAYRGFFDLVAVHLASVVAKARADVARRARADALAALDRAKTDFFSNVSHEFRTPLTLLLGPLEDVLAAGAQIPPWHRAQIETAHRAALRLLKLVNALLDFSQLEADRVKASFEGIDLARYTADLASMFRPAIERGGLTLRVDCEPLPEPVYVDRDMWEKIIFNLLSNAFKFTFEGEIAVVLRAVPGAAELAISDTGAGIPPEQTPHLFERFHRVPGTRARTQEGTGIGLSLVHQLVHLHGGEITVSSEVDRGTVFTVRLPFGTDHLPADRIGARRTDAATRLGGAEYVEEALRWLPDGAPTLPNNAQIPSHNTASLQKDSTPVLVDSVPTVANAGHILAGDEQLLADADPFGPPPIDASGGNAVILVADDNADMRAHLQRILSAHWKVVLAPDGVTALATARYTRPDLVVADVTMPGLDGFGVLRELRADPATEEIPVILVSARAGAESTVEGLDAGADDYLIKPFTASELVARVRTHLRTARIRELAIRRTRALAHASHALSTTLDTRDLVDVLTTLVVPQWADECVVWLRTRSRTDEWRAEPLVRGSARRATGLYAAVQADAEAAAADVGVAGVMATQRPRHTRTNDGRVALTLPLVARGHLVGAFTVCRRRELWWRPTDIGYLTDLGHRLALALDNAARYEAERSVAVTLQRSLLPSDLPDIDGVALAARYQPGGAGASVGGDWYDAFPLPDGGVGLAIGDVMGHGVRAAAIMGQLRAALRGYALENMTPAELLTRLDAYVEASGEPHLSTCIYARYDPSRGRLRLASAGHLPPLVVPHGGPGAHLQLPVGLPLGVGDVDGITYLDHEIDVAAGSLVLFYTDGLIENRTQSLDEGIRALEAATARAFAGPDDACDHLLAALTGGVPNDDDTTLLAMSPAAKG